MLSKLMILKNYIKYKHFMRFHTREALVKYQDKKIRKVVSLAKTKSPFFKDYYSGIDKFEDLPLINKNIMMDNFDRFNTLGIKKEDAFELAIKSESNRDFSPKLGKVSVGLSSGTSGHRGLFLVSESEKNMWAGAMLAKILPNGLQTSTKIAFFLRANNNLYESVNTRKITLKYFDMLKPIESHIDQVNKLDPDILVAPPQVLIELAKLRNDNQLMKTPAKIISVAEVLQDDDAAFIKEQFDTKTIHQIYQCTEGFLAHTCKHGTIHVNEDIVKVEKEYIGDGRFIPIITDFTRTSQTIIRYRLNDILIEEPETCPCGSVFMAIKKIEGREDDTFLFKRDGDEGLVSVYPDFIRRAITYVDGILDYKALQESPTHMCIQMNHITDKQKNDLVNEFVKLAGKMGFVPPEITFEPFVLEKDKKLRRIQRLFKSN